MWSPIFSNQNSMTHASQKSYQKIKESEPGMEKRILAFLKKHHVTCGVIEFVMDLRHETASARLAELHKKGLIRPYAECNGQTEWGASQDNEIESVKASVEAERKKKWVKQGLQLFKDMPEDLREQLKQMAA